MNNFDCVIGYDSIKKELCTVLDMLKNPDVYRELGANPIHGVLLEGEPGTGKTMMAEAFIKDSKIPAFKLRLDTNSDNMIERINDAFIHAKQKTPSIVFLDDVDKFSNDDRKNSNAAEYITIQSCIDSVRSSNVLVIATANDIDRLPKSLVRPGRFDKLLHFDIPSRSDSIKIVRYFMSQKKVNKDVDLTDIAKMINYKSCAQLEGIINAAAIECAFERDSEIETRHLVSSVLRELYGADDDYIDDDTSDDFNDENRLDKEQSEADRRKIALHEAGHLVVAEAISKGSVGFANIRLDGTRGVVHLCKKMLRRPHYILLALASKAAVELQYPDPVASGCDDDLSKAISLIQEGMLGNATAGFSLLRMNVRHSASNYSYLSNEMATTVELERYFRKAKDILVKNHEFLEKITDALMEKGTLLHSEIQAIRNSVPIVEPVI